MPAYPKKTIEEVLQELINAGLDALPGGGAEMFSLRVRKEMCPTKLYVNQWIDVHRAAHRLGIKSNATMLYGHIEEPGEIIEHLKIIRDTQDDTQGFLTFIPLKYQPEHSPYGGKSCSGLKDLLVHAIARIYLDNVPHIKSYWTMLGVKCAQTLLLFGADDFDGTVIDERIVHMAGSASPKMLTATKIRRLIEETGLEPVERDTFFNPVTRA